MLFLTGLPRSGTSWAAHALARALGAELDFEPFNWRTHDPDRKRWFMQLLDGPEPAFDAIVESTGDAARPHIAKDVHTCLALERWAQVHPRIVVLARHPCAVAASWQALDYPIGWQAEVLLGQPALTDGLLAPFVDHLRPTGDYFTDLGAYWGASYFVLDALSRDRHEWRLVTHEALCTGEPEAFAPVLDGLPADLSALGDFLAEADAPIPSPDDRYSVLRRTRDEPEKWRARLDRAAQDAVRAGAEPFGIADRLYAW